MCLIKKVSAADRKVWRLDGYNLISAERHLAPVWSKISSFSTVSIDTLSNSAVWKSFLFRKANTRAVEEDCLLSTCSQTISEVLVLWDKTSEYMKDSAFYNHNPCMRFNLSLKFKSLRCEGKVDWSCSVLRARRRQERSDFKRWEG